jgi:hypothetical protein
MEFWKYKKSVVLLDFAVFQTAVLLDYQNFCWSHTTIIVKSSEFRNIMLCSPLFLRNIPVPFSGSKSKSWKKPAWNRQQTELSSQLTVTWLCSILSQKREFLIFIFSKYDSQFWWSECMLPNLCCYTFSVYHLLIAVFKCGIVSQLSRIPLV